MRTTPPSARSIEIGIDFGIGIDAGIDAGITGALRDVVSVRGEIDMQTAPALCAVLRVLVDESTDLLVDLAHVDFMDAAGLEMIADVARRLSAFDRRLVLRSVPEAAARLLQLSGVDHSVRLEGPVATVSTLGAEQRADDRSSAVTSRAADLATELMRLGESVDVRAVDAALLIVTQLADATVEGADGVSVTLRRDGRLLTVASSNETVLQMDQHQYDTGQGPCLAAADEGRWFHIESLASEERWHTFVPRARDEGIASILSSPLMSGDHPVGALNIYSNTERAFGQPQQDLAALLATLASGILVDAGAGSDDGDRVARISAALSAREIIARAQGIIMARQNVSGEDAAAQLHRSARSAESTVLERATGITEHAERAEHDFGQSE